MTKESLTKTSNHPQKDPSLPSRALGRRRVKLTAIARFVDWTVPLSISAKTVSVPEAKVNSNFSCLSLLPSASHTTNDERNTLNKIPTLKLNSPPFLPTEIYLNNACRELWISKSFLDKIFILANLNDVVMIIAYEPGRSTAKLLIILGPFPNLSLPSCHGLELCHHRHRNDAFLQRISSFWHILVVWA